MAVRPLVHLFFPCADAAVDEANNSVTLVDPIRALYLPADSEFPFSVGKLFFYVCLSQGFGKFHCRIEVRDDNGKLIAKTTPTTINLTADNRFVGFEFVMQLPEFELPRLGSYWFILQANYSRKPLAKASILFLKGT